jgi:prepilin-type N-terminal cleavage/methylation domain-containing protein
MKKTREAFSLIELSIVILVVGILVAGVFSSSRLVSNSRIKTAQTLTQSSPVAGIKGLSLWLETTSSNSFVAGVEDGDDITTWNDINPQTTQKFFALRSISDSTLEYRENDNDSIGHLPSLYFSGSVNQILTLCTNSDISQISSTKTPLVTPFNAYTFFVVVKKIGAETGANGILYNGKPSYPRNGWGGLFSSDEGPQTYILYSSNNNFGMEPVLNDASYILTASYDGNGIYSAYNAGSPMTMPSIETPAIENIPTTEMVIGAYSNIDFPWKGYISEIIVYNRAIKKEERESVESYLSRKYSIPVSFSNS